LALLVHISSGHGDDAPYIEVITVSVEPRQHLTPIPADQVDYLIATAARAPSVHNTQPWRFRVTAYALELYSDPARKLRVDPLGREMVISCGAALFGLRLAIRSLGFMPLVEIVPTGAPRGLLARISLGAPRPMDSSERQMLAAVPHRHTHRGPFSAEPMPTGLLARLVQDAGAEGATLSVLERDGSYERLVEIIHAAGRAQDPDPGVRADMRNWTRSPGSHARDGVPAAAFASGSDRHRGRLAQRDFDLGRKFGELEADGPAPAATALLLTPGDGVGDWLCAGQALHRVLARAATQWVFASLYTQPLESAAFRDMIVDGLMLPGAPQMILQLGPARSTRVTARRPPADLLGG
jgi:nitroreductase